MMCLRETLSWGLGLHCFEGGFAAELERVRTHLAQGTAIEIWSQDEARVGQKNTITRRWAKHGTRPSAPHAQRTTSTYIFGKVCPALGKSAELVLPSGNTAAMKLHRAEIAQTVVLDAMPYCPWIRPDGI